MLNDFKEYLLKLGMFSYGRYKTFIAAATPGLDSVVMCHLLKEIGALKGIAHCNYGLLKSSDEDEGFVLNLALELEVPFYHQRFSTRKYAQHWDIPQQVAARRLRFGFLEKTRMEAKVDYVATAFNGDEAQELLFINMARGSGLMELTCTRPKTFSLVRPLLFASRAEIQQYANEKGLNYQPDKSEWNEDTMHAKVREHVIPAMQALNPHFMKGMRETMERWHSAAEMLRSSVTNRHYSWDHRNRVIEVSLYGLKDTPESMEKLYHSVKDFGFDYEQAVKMLVSLQKRDYYHSNNDVYQSETHVATVGGYRITIHQKDYMDIMVENLRQAPVQLPQGFLTMELVKEKYGTSYTSPSHVLYLDADKVEFPLHLKRWNPDDPFEAASSYTRPQTLHTYFGNRKISGAHRENFCVIWSGGKICCIAGQEVDMRFAPTSSTKNLLAIGYYGHLDTDQEY